MKVLFAVPPLVGHTNPTVAVARALVDAGHDVAWVAHPSKVRPLLPAGARLFALPEDIDADHARAIDDRAKVVRGAAALKFLWEDFLAPLARQMRPGIEAAVDAFAPDVLAVDQQTVAGGLVARRRGMRWATLSTTSAGLVDPFAALPAVKRWHRDLFAELEREAGLPPAEFTEVSPHLVLAFTTTALVGRDDFPPHYRFVGPSLGARPEPDDFPFDQLRRPCVLVSMGTVNAEASGRFYATAIAALADVPAQVVLVAPPALAPPPLPANIIARPHVPQLALLPHVDAVICHAGHNTTCEALAHAVPLVVAPIKDDQPIVAEQVVAAGCGVRVKFGRVQPAELRDATMRVLTEPAFRAAAAVIAASFERAGGAPAAARALEEMA